MDAWFVWSLIFLGLAGLVLLGALFVPKVHTKSVPYNEDTEDEKQDGQVTFSPRREVRQLAFIPLGIAVFMLLMSTWVLVGTNKIGVFTSFNAAYTATDNGFELKRPWAKRTEFDASRQFLRFCGDGNSDEDADKKVYPKVHLRIDGNATADICGTITWQMKATTKAEKDNAIALFKDYKVFDRVTTNLVYPNVRQILNTVLAKQNPLVPEKNMTVADINKNTLDALKTEFSGSVIIIAADISPPDYDPKTDEAIAADLAQKALTALAVEKKKTNEAEALANDAIKVSVQDPMILLNKCLDISKQLNYNPGLCLMGSGSVILPGDAFSKK